jgi:anaerobic selenocysteine-containing dehydrogenase
MNRLGRILLEEASPPVRVLFVYNANPLATVPDQERVRAGLAREDLFTVVFDQVMTDSARHADVVLPATTFLEHPELGRGYGPMVVQRSEPAIGPVAEARSNHEVFLELCRRLDLARPGDAETVEEFAAAALAADGRAPETAAALAERGIAPAAVTHPVQMVDVLPRTANGRIQLFPADLDATAPAGLYGYLPDPAAGNGRLALISPATHHTVSSTLGELQSRPAALELHPEDAHARGIADGDPVRVWNELGEVRCRASLSEVMRPGVVALPKGLWSHHTANGATSNALVPDTLGPLAGGACFNDARVEVERLPPARRLTATAAHPAPR